MIKRFVCGLLVLSSFGCGSLWAADSFTGAWKLNVAKSTFAKGREVKEETVTIAEQGDNLMVTVKGAYVSGKAISIKYAMPAKGGPLSYTEGTPLAGAGATTVAKRVDANTLDGTTSMNGKQVGTTHTVVSADGKTITQTRSDMDESGKAMKTVVVFNRQ